MSGGVDSSVAAFLLKKQGYDCIGSTMVLRKAGGIEKKDGCAEDKDNCSENKNGCAEDKDGGTEKNGGGTEVEDVLSVCRKLDMPCRVFHFEEEFEAQVIRPFAEAYTRGITPNPCIRCNRCLKFGKLLEAAKDLHCDYISTGHYAVITKEDGRYFLKKAPDNEKDQSYVLWSMTQEQLSHTIFPLGNLKKEEVRRIAEENGFRNAGKPESQDICFVPDGKYTEVIKEYTDSESGPGFTPGDFVDTEGNILGKHRGIVHYTIGQRRGLGLALPESLYVREIRPEDNTVVLARNAVLFSRTALIRDFNWISGESPVSLVRCSAKVRYRHREQPVSALSLGNGLVELTFDEPQRAITPGQSAVLYDGDCVLGGGVICRPEELL